MSSDIHSVLVGEVWRKAGMVAKASGSPITAGTVNYYLLALTGANAGKWWKNSDQTWAVGETANAMTHKADGCWTIALAASPFINAILYLEYAKESGGLHVAAEGRLLRGTTNVDEAAIKLKTDTIGTGAATVAAPVAQNLDVALYQRDDYDFDEARSLDWTNSAGTWGGGDLTDAIVQMVFMYPRTGAPVLVGTGSVVTPTGVQHVRVELTAAETALLVLSGPYLYQLRVTLPITLRHETIVSGTATVTKSGFAT